MVRSGLTAEQLPPAPPQDSASSRPSLLRVLLGSESLPEAPAALPASRSSLLSVLFARELLPLDPEQKRTHRNWLAFLFAPERLDPPGGAGPEVH
jgi:hypothetical protein